MSDRAAFTQLTVEELAAIVQEGEYRGCIKVMAHPQGAEGIKNAVRAAVRSTEHGIYLDDEAIELMVKVGTFLVPTLVTTPADVLETAEAGRDLLPQVIHKAQETIETHRENIGRAFQAGAHFAMVTDAGVVPHGTNRSELGLMAAIGLSPEDKENDVLVMKDDRIEIERGVSLAKGSK
jgi:imidazolonepropionase-like amidohydrolase